MVRRAVIGQHENTSLRAEVAAAMRQFEVPGLAVAVVKDGRTVFAKAFTTAAC